MRFPLAPRLMILNDLELL